MDKDGEHGANGIVLLFHQFSAPKSTKNKHQLGHHASEEQMHQQLGGKQVFYRACVMNKYGHEKRTRTHRANDIESDAITSPVITFSLGCKVRQMVTLALYKVALVTLCSAAYCGPS